MFSDNIFTTVTEQVSLQKNGNSNAQKIFSKWNCMSNELATPSRQSR